jgi:hypothetical protein
MTARTREVQVASIASDAFSVHFEAPTLLKSR